TNDEQDASGMIYFCWKNLKNKTKSYNGKNVNLPTYLRYNVFSNKALQPICAWMPATCPGSITNLSRSGRTLTWKGVEGMRYTIYAVPKSLDPANFHKEECYLKGISYSESYTIPETDAKYPGYGIADADLDNYNYAVCIYDRYGNEYSAYFAGIAPASATTPTLTTPSNGAVAPPAFNFEWNGNSQMYEIIVARNADLTDIVYRREHAERSIAAADVATFEPGTTYYWAVVARSNGVADLKSDVAAFTVDTFRILSPSDEESGCADNPTITWNELGNNVEYTLTVATDNAMSKTVYTMTAKALKADIPAYTLSGNTTYYATVTATVNDREYTTNVSSFKTALTEGHVPVFVNPASDGQTIHSDEMVEVEPQRGITQLKIMIASTTSFSARSSYNGTFTKFETKTPALSEIKLGSAALADGNTYYIRANVSYIGPEGSTVTTDWTEPRSFVYSAEQGAVASIKAGSAHYSAGTIVCAAEAAVAVYTSDGREVANGNADAAGRFDVAALPTGVYIVKITGAEKATIKFVKSE
ncbi:MAG: T9SS type A sorting domain-containing protein, partial [Candidatus Limisoma sp.]